MKPAVSIIIPTRNAGAPFKALLAALGPQHELIVVDTASSDGTPQAAAAAGARVIPIVPQQFDHGASRNLGARASVGGIIVFLTQDALPLGPEAIDLLIAPMLRDATLGAAYGRQLPVPDATPGAAHLRLFNYPAQSRIKTLSDRATMGIRAAAISNSFSAYSREAMARIGWFHEGLIMGEDAVAGAELLLAGYKIAYVAEARALHSHNYTLLEEMRRYFDIGVFHRTEAVLIREFGKPSGEGLRFVRSELAYLAREGFYLSIPGALARTALKLAGYKLGYNFRLLPRPITRALCMNKGWMR